MVFINECYKNTNVPLEYLEGFIKLLNPVAPHITEELYHTILNKTDSIANSNWPTYIEELTKENTITFVVQVNGKIRDKLLVANNTPKEELERLALASEKIIANLDGKTPKKVIVVPNKLVSIVI